MSLPFKISSFPPSFHNNDDNVFVTKQISPANTVQELEGMISEQRQLMEKLTDQCKNLTQKLEDTSHQHK